MRYALLLLLLLSACARQTEITGEVYVVTEGRQTVKLSGSQVFIRHKSDLSVLEKMTKENALEVLRTLPAPVAVTTTDSEGRFKIAVPPGEYAIEVEETRAIGRDKEFYCWLVPANGHVVLNNSNLINLTP
jgi:hypothetical protein